MTTVAREGGQATPSQPSDEEWRLRLSPEQYRILRRRGTEAPHAGRYLHVTAAGVYHCAGCGAPLFASERKYDSGTGWPSFWEAIDPAAVTRRRDWSMLIPRTEVRCSRCHGHLGHVFNDGPAPTGQRFCVNSAALVLRKRGSGA